MDDFHDKNPVLEAARKEGKGKEYESKVETKSIIIATFATLVVGIVLFLVEYFSKKTINLSLISILMTMCCVQLLYEGTKTKTIWKIIVGTLQAIFAVLCIIGFFYQVLS